MRTLNAIARDIYEHWKNVHYAAKPYLAAMFALQHISESYGQDDARGIVLYFLSNARTWKGPDAKQIKAELKEMCK